MGFGMFHQLLPGCDHGIVLHLGAIGGAEFLEVSRGKFKPCGK